MCPFGLDVCIGLGLGCLGLLRFSSRVCATVVMVEKLRTSDQRKSSLLCHFRQCMSGYGPVMLNIHLCTDTTKASFVLHCCTKIGINPTTSLPLYPHAIVGPFEG